MKEVTYEEWVKNSTPREMWVWNKEDGSDKVVRKVVHILNVEPYYFPIMTVNKNNSHTSTYKHCAELPKARRMTNKELSRWLREKPTRECKTLNDSNDNFVYCFHTYLERCANEEVDDLILIREDDGEWHEPLVEVEE